MDERRKKALLKWQPQLRNEITVKMILPDLQSRSVLTPQEVQKVDVGESNRDRVDQLIYFLLNKTASVFDKFCDILRNHNQCTLANQLSRYAAPRTGMKKVKAVVYKVVHRADVRRKRWDLEEWESNLKALSERLEAEERKRQEEERKRQAEERRRQEAERRRREEERRRQEEERRRQEEERKRQEAEKRRRQEAERRQEEEKRLKEERRRLEEAKRRQEEERRRAEVARRERQEASKKLSAEYAVAVAGTTLLVPLL